MTVCVFTGPTLAPDDGRAILPAAFLPPAAHGDVCRAVMRRPRPAIIVIIDGAFRTVPAVRHKEILWALAEGVHVLGGASMGALRAAELADFGMVGVGAVFEDFRSGVLEDDDEVAVDHGPAEAGHLPLNTAMVDIRATLAAAAAQGIITSRVHDRLVGLAKAMFYRDRRYRTLLARARAEGVAVEALAAWLPGGRVERKRDDALATLRRARELALAGPPPFTPPFVFEPTEAWETDRAAAAAMESWAAAMPGPLATDPLQPRSLS